MIFKKDKIIEFGTAFIHIPNGCSIDIDTRMNVTFQGGFFHRGTIEEAQKAIKSKEYKDFCKNYIPLDKIWRKNAHKLGMLKEAKFGIKNPKTDTGWLDPK